MVGPLEVVGVWPLVAALIGLTATVVGVFGLGASAIVEILTGRHTEPVLLAQVNARLTAVVKSALAAGFGASVFVAKSMGEERADWVDEDENGILDPFVNGRYDYIDLVLGEWLVAWGQLCVYLGLVVAALWVLGRFSPSGSPSARRG